MLEFLGWGRGYIIVPRPALNMGLVSGNVIINRYPRGALMRVPDP